jgi:hypothetical protein
MRPWISLHEIEKTYTTHALSPPLAAREYLSTHHHWPEGLLNVFENSRPKIAKRIVICDDSTFMEAAHGTRITIEAPTAGSAPK